jgi:hypothetical protein
MVQESHWMSFESCDFMKINEKTKLHVCLERIWINIAASFGVKWQQIEHATENETKLFSAKIITLLLIISKLKSIYNMTQNEIDVMIGRANAELIDEYFSYLKEKNK